MIHIPVLPGAACIDHDPELWFANPDIDLIANAPADLAALLGDAEKLNEVREFHRNWGDQDTDTLDGLDLWEQLGRLLGVTP